MAKEPSETAQEEYFAALQQRLCGFREEMSAAAKELEARGVASHFQDLLLRFEALTLDFDERLEETSRFLDFLKLRQLPIAAATEGYFAILPEEVILQILAFLPERDLVTMTCLSTTWTRLASDDLLWRKLYFKRWKKRPSFALLSRGTSIGGAHEKLKGTEESGVAASTPSTSACAQQHMDSSRFVWRESFMRACHCERNWKEANYQVHSLHHPSAVLCVAFNQDKIVSGSADETVKVWDLKTKQCVHALKGHVYTVKSVQFDESRIISGGGTKDRTLKIWDMRTGACLHTLEGHKGGVFALQYDQDKIVSGATDRTMRIWSMRTKKCTKILRGHKHDIYCLQYEGNTLISGAGSGDRTLCVWDMEVGKPLQELQGHQGGVFCLYFRHNCVASGSKGEIKIWDLNSGQCVHTLDKHNSFVLGLQFDDTKMVSGGYEQEFAIKVWDWRMMQLRYRLLHHKGTCFLKRGNAIWLILI
ncbi:F-box/WD repeat-containing protein 7, variant 2 [Balamuthia mandrillaris]